MKKFVVLSMAVALISTYSVQPVTTGLINNTIEVSADTEDDVTLAYTTSDSTITVDGITYTIQVRYNLDANDKPIDCVADIIGLNTAKFNVIVPSTFDNLTIDGLTFDSVPVKGILCRTPKSILSFESSSINEIGAECFKNTNLIKINMPMLDTIGNNAFENTSIETIDLEVGNVTIGDEAFKSCKNLHSFISGIVSLGKGCFKDCSNLKSFRGLTAEIPDQCFYNCTSLRHCPTLSSDVIRIGEEAFYSCEAIDSITLAHDLKSIGNNAFELCTGLQSVKFNGVASEGLKYRIFKDCTRLKEVLNYDASIIPASMFENCYLLEKFEFTGNTNLTSIGDYAFYNCNSLTELDFGDSVVEGVGTYCLGTTKGLNVFASDMSTLLKAYCTEFEMVFNNNFLSILLGDVNGDGKVNTSDLLKLKKYLLGTIDEVSMLNSDINGDGKVNTSDLLKLKKVLLGLDEL